MSTQMTRQQRRAGCSGWRIRWGPSSCHRSHRWQLSCGGGCRPAGRWTAEMSCCAEFCRIRTNKDVIQGSNSYVCNTYAIWACRLYISLNKVDNRRRPNRLIRFIPCQWRNCFLLTVLNQARGRSDIGLSIRSRRDLVLQR